MEELIKFEETIVKEPKVNPEAIEKLAVELIKGNYETIAFQLSREPLGFGIMEEAFGIELLVDEKFKITIEATRLK
jgi:hypothetical protein